MININLSLRETRKCVAQKFCGNNFSIFPLTFSIGILQIGHVWLNGDICRFTRVLERHSGRFTLYLEDLRATRKQNVRHVTTSHTSRVRRGLKQRVKRKRKKNEKNEEYRKMKKKIFRTEQNAQNKLYLLFSQKSKDLFNRKSS